MIRLVILLAYICSIHCAAGAAKLPFSSLRRAAASAIASLALLDLPATCFAESRLVGNIPTSGLIFKDTLKVTSFDDPKVQGVTLYIRYIPSMLYPCGLQMNNIDKYLNNYTPFATFIAISIDQ
jgi:hypothetical protein